MVESDREETQVMTASTGDQYAMKVKNLCRNNAKIVLKKMTYKIVSVSIAIRILLVLNYELFL